MDERFTIRVNPKNEPRLYNWLMGLKENGANVSEETKRIIRRSLLNQELEKKME